MLCRVVVHMIIALDSPSRDFVRESHGLVTVLTPCLGIRGFPQPKTQSNTTKRKAYVVEKRFASLNLRYSHKVVKITHLK